MKRILIMAAFVTACLGQVKAVSSSDFNVVPDVSLFSEASYGKYNGTLTNVTMNGKSYNDVPGITFSLNKNGTLSGTVGKIGKMPGTITINVPVSVDESGNVSAIQGAVAGRLAFSFGGGTNLYVQSLTGNVNSGTLQFTLETYGSFLGMSVFPASVSFNGVAQ